VSQGYQNRDRAVVDYDLWQAVPGGDWLRGPRPADLSPGSYVACVGAAQTFGCFVERPWPQLLADELGVPALNLGVAGAGPALFRTEPFRRLLRGARAVIFQVMSGRSADNSRFTSGGRERLQVHGGDDMRSADAAWRDALHGDLAGVQNPLVRGARNRLLATFGRRDVRRLVDETRADWVTQFRALLDETTAPTALLWFSRRTPHHRPRYHSLRALFGEFPQLVDERMVGAVAPRADRYVECVTSRGSPQPLATPVRPADAGTGADPQLVWTHNAYYPSPQMHEDAAAALLEPVRALLAAR